MGEILSVQVACSEYLRSILKPLSSHRAFGYRTMTQSCLQDKQEWLSLCKYVKTFLLFLVVSHIADMLSLKVVLLIFLNNYAINRMKTAWVRNWASVQTETSSETAEESYHSLLITLYCEIPFSSQHSALGTASSLPVLFHLLQPAQTNSALGRHHRDDS